MINIKYDKLLYIILINVTQLHMIDISNTYHNLLNLLFIIKINRRMKSA
jgi:hypothetical protein